MPRKPSGTYDDNAYQNAYHKAMKTKLISFNTNSPDDMALWTFLVQKANVTKYIKALIRSDMERGQEAGK